MSDKKEEHASTTSKPRLMDKVHPGILLFAASAPLCFLAVRGYRKSTEQLVKEALKIRTKGVVKLSELETAEEDVRKAIGSTLASRALVVATLGSAGIFGMGFAGCFFATGARSFPELYKTSREWAHQYRRRIDEYFGIEPRVDKDHEEYQMLERMSEEDQLNYIGNKHFSEVQKEDLDDSNTG